jgi:preprotein translocase subunit SecA
MRSEDMVDRVVSRFIGTKHERDIKRLAPKVAAINELAGEFERLTDTEIHEKSAQLKVQVTDRLGKAEPSDTDYKQRLVEALEPFIAPAFALAREAGRRTLAMRHFDVQLIGGMVLHDGKIAEMKTGEGKTLVATLPAYLNSLTGRGVHIVTVNDYLARRDAEWMGPLYRALGLTVGVIVHDLDDAERRAA